MLCEWPTKEGLAIKELKDELYEKSLLRQRINGDNSDNELETEARTGKN